MSHRMTTWLRVAVAATISAAFAWPVVWMVITAVRPSHEALRYTTPFQRRTVIPDTLTLDNVIGLVSGPFMQALANSFLVASVSVVLGVLFAAAAAYAFATARFPGKNVLFAVVVFSFMIPFEVLAIPLAVLFRDLGLTNSYFALILPGLGNGMAVFLLRQFFLGVPEEISEAATLDGVGWAGIFFRMYLPLSRPSLISAGLIIFLFQWQAYLWPLLITTDQAHQVGPIALAHFFGQSYNADYGLIFAGSVVLTLIPAVLLLFFQRHLVATAVGSGVKG